MKIDTDVLRLQRIINQYALSGILTQDMIASAELVIYDQDEGVLEANQPMHYFYFFVSGKLKVFQVHENGRALLLQFYSAFDSLGEVEFMNDAPATCSAVAVQESLLIRIPFEVMHHSAKNHPPFLRYVIRSLSAKLMAADKHHAYNLLYPVKNRLSSYLKAYSQNTQMIELKDSMQEISEYIGTTYRQLHRAFDQLQKSGIIDKKGKRILIQNTSELESLAGELYTVDLSTIGHIERHGAK